MPRKQTMKHSSSGVVTTNSSRASGFWWLRTFSPQADQQRKLLKQSGLSAVKSLVWGFSATVEELLPKTWVMFPNFLPSSTSNLMRGTRKSVFGQDHAQKVFQSTLMLARAGNTSPKNSKPQLYKLYKYDMIIAVRVFSDGFFS